MFKWLRPQLIEHADGYRIGSNGRESIQYTDSQGDATLCIDRGLSDNALYPDTLRRWTTAGEEVFLSPTEHQLLMERFVAGMQVIGGTPVLLEHSPLAKPIPPKR